MTLKKVCFSQRISELRWTTRGTIHVSFIYHFLSSYYMSVTEDAEMCSKQLAPSVSLLPGRKSRPLQVLA